MTKTEIPFEQLEQRLAEDGVDAVLAELVRQLRQQSKYHELFEALKMQVRRRLGLPLLYNDSGDDLDEQQRTQLEDGLLEACREVGTLLLEAHKVREGWMYLRPVGNRAEVARRLATIGANDDNVEELIEVCLHEGVDPARGFRLVLEQYGTCNAITTFESALTRHSEADQRQAAGMLVEHLHEQLLASVTADVAQREGKSPPQKTLEGLVSGRSSLFGEHAYHIDTTHLASTVRFARTLTDPKQLQLAVDLTEYGRRLHPQFQYPGEEPFVELYPSHARYFRALLGQEVEPAIEFFRERVQASDPERNGSQPMEVFLQLLDRLGRFPEAVEALLQYARQHETPAQQLLPLLLSLSAKAGSFQAVLEYCRERGDLLGFATALVQAERGD